MTMQLYTASITIEVIVRADSPEQAQRIAEREWLNETVDAHDFEVAPMTSIPGAWDADCYVYGDHKDDRTVSECIAAGEAPKYSELLAKIKAVKAVKP